MDNIETIFKQQAAIKTDLNKQLEIFEQLIKKNDDGTGIIKKALEQWNKFHAANTVLESFRITNEDLNENEYFVNEVYRQTGHIMTKLFSRLLDYQAICAREQRQKENSLILQKQISFARRSMDPISEKSCSASKLKCKRRRVLCRK
jgi:hypothetical protein